MPQSSATDVYKKAAEVLFAEPPLPLERLFSDPLVRLRVGIVISEGVTEAEHHSWPPHALAVLKRPRLSGPRWEDTT